MANSIIISVVFILFVYAVIRVVKSHKNGSGCGCGCKGCSIKKDDCKHGLL